MLPLAGIRILDLTIVWGGPYCGKQFADFGAEVIKIDSARYLDTTRGLANPPAGAGIYPDGDPGERPWNRAGYYNSVNTSKLGLALDLTTPEGVAIFKRLVKISDVVVDNFRIGVMERFGLTYPVLKEVNPMIIVATMSAYGYTGPERTYAAFGATLEQTTGISWLTGYGSDDPPYRGGVNYPDPVGGLHAAGAILAALRYRRKTGKGQFIDLSQKESAACVVGEGILDYTMNGRIAERMGNRHPYWAPHGCYQCKGDDMWVTIAVTSDDQWEKLAAAMGKPAWAADKRFMTTACRWHNQDDLDRRIGEWTATRDHVEIMHVLQKAGVPAGAVHKNYEILEDPHLNERGFFQQITHPEAGTHQYYGASVKLSATPGSIQSAAPCLGQHNDYILRDLLGLSDEEMRGLSDKNVTCTNPRAIGAAADK